MINSYDNASTVANEDEILNAFQARSFSCYQQYPCIPDLPYGSSKRACLDLFQSEGATKTVVFIHGGYWQWCNKSDFAFIAPYVLEQQMQCVLLEYDLAPHCSLTEIVAQVKCALNFIVQQDWMTKELILIGHSAGAHLTALMLEHPKVNHAVMLSGIYDLYPIQYTPLNQALQLTELEIATLSPIHHPTQLHKTYEIYCGQDELASLQWQSKHYFEKRQLIDSGQVKLEFMPNINHYTILTHYFKHYLHNGLALHQ